jgi:hypothetical protein
MEENDEHNNDGEDQNDIQNHDDKTRYSIFSFIQYFLFQDHKHIFNQKLIECHSI